MSLMWKTFHWRKILVLICLFLLIGWWGAIKFVFAADTATVVQEVTQPGRLMASGDGKNVWLLSPVWADSNQTQDGFLLLNHQTNTFYENKPLWSQVANSTFLGIPADAATPSLIDPQYDGSLLTIFPEGILSSYSLDENGDLQQNTLPPLPFHIQPFAGVGTADGYCVLGYGSMQVPAMGPARATHPAVTTQSELQFSVPTSEPAVPLLTLPPSWWVFYSVPGGWRHVPGPDLPPPVVDATTTGQTIPQLVWLRGQLWAFWFDAGDRTRVEVSSLATTEKNAQWSAPSVLNLPQSADAFSVVANDTNVFLLWYAAPPQLPLQIGGAVVNVDGPMPRLTLWPATTISGNIHVGDLHVIEASRSVAATRDGDSVSVFIRSADSKLYAITFDGSGKTITDLSQLSPTVTPEVNPDDYQQMFIFGMIFLIALFLWQRKQTFTGLDIARLYLRVGAAVIDVAIGGLATVLIFGMYTQQQWAALWTQGMDIIVTHQNLMGGDFQAICLLAIYELHVTIGECLFGRSVGKWIFSIRVVSLDGSKAPITSILVRNVVRIVEIELYVLLIFVLVSTDRQRLGDHLARTLVIHDSSKQQKN
jgi:uncharacterized RDD family membrane protein YckC